MSEFFKEYTHLVADPTKTWPYFDIPGCLKRLTWSVGQCYKHLAPHWLPRDEGLSRHAVVQLALYACGPFLDIQPDLDCLRCVSRDGTPCRPPGDLSLYFHSPLPDGYYYRAEPVGYLTDQYSDKSENQKQHQYLCPTIVPLIEALATALIRHESWCEYTYGWSPFQEQRDIAIGFLEDLQKLFSVLRRKDIPAEHPSLYHKKDTQEELQKAIDIAKVVTLTDYQHAGGPTDAPGDPRAHGNKHILLKNMDEAFRIYGPAQWSREATYRALASIMNQLQIKNAQGNDWSPGAIKKFLRDGPDRRLRFRINIIRPNVEPWYTRPG
jgi:hypothetical protein